MESFRKGVDSVSVTPVAAVLDLPEDQVRMLLVWIIQFFVGWFMHFCVRGTTLRHTFSFIMGFLGVTYFYGVQLIHVIMMSAVSWSMMAILPRDKQQNYITVFVFAYLSYNHITRLLYNFDGYDIEITFQTMTLTLRLYALAYSYHDGGVGESEKNQLTAR